MRKKAKPIQKLSKSLNISETDIKDIIVKEHELKHLYKDSELVDIGLTFDMKDKSQKKSYEFVKSLATKLKVSQSAVISHVVSSFLKKEGYHE